MDDSTEKLKARISELENLIEKLRQETGSLESAKTSTPYDDAWRTLTVSTSRLLIPMVNEVFGEHFSEHATVTLAHNEHLFSALDGKTEKRITDTNFSIDEVFGGSTLGDGFDIADGSTRKRYLFECESKPVTGRILVRIVEYAIKAGLEEGTTADRDTIVISIPQAAILSLRSTANTPDALNIVIKTEKGETSSAVRVMMLSDYTASSVMEKKLYLLIPFLLFNYEKQFQQIQEDEEQYKALLREYAEVFRRLDALIPAGGEDASLIDVYTSRALRAMTHTVVNGLARKYPRIKEGVNSVVGGNIILFDAAEARLAGLREGEQKGLREGVQKGLREGVQKGLREGVQKGLREGKREGKIITLYECVQDGDIPLQKAAKRAGLNESDFIKNMNAAGYQLPRENRA